MYFFLFRLNSMNILFIRPRTQDKNDSKKTTSNGWNTHLLVYYTTMDGKN